MVNNFGISSGIDLSEVSAVKQMIFQRAQEKQSTDTQNVQGDVMAEARASVSSDKPKLFGGLTGLQQNPEPKQETPPREVKHNIQSVQDTTYANSMRDEVMYSATNNYRKKATLAESLKFLNTQAAINMANKTHSKIV